MRQRIKLRNAIYPERSERWGVARKGTVHLSGKVLELFKDDRIFKEYKSNNKHCFRLYCIK